MLNWLHMVFTPEFYKSKMNEQYFYMSMYQIKSLIHCWLISLQDFTMVFIIQFYELGLLEHSTFDSNMFYQILHLFKVNPQHALQYLI